MNLVEGITKTKILFFYGTLRDHEVREAVIGDQAKQLNLVDAYLIGYKLYRVKNTNYPLIVREKSSSNKFRNCLGKLFLDKGHSLEPVPPARIIGTILFIVFEVIIHLDYIQKNLYF